MSKVGRKVAVLIPLLGYILYYFMTLVVIYFNLGIMYMVVANVLVGITGGYALLLGALFAGAGDESAPQDRTWRVGLMEGCLFVGACSGSAASGSLITSLGIQLSMLVIIVLSFVAILLAFAAPEPLPAEHRLAKPNWSHAMPWGAVSILFRFSTLCCLGDGSF